MSVRNGVFKIGTQKTKTCETLFCANKRVLSAQDPARATGSKMRASFDF